MSFEILKKFISTAVVSTVHLYELIFDSGYIYDFVTCLVETQDISLCLFMLYSQASLELHGNMDK